MAEVASAYVSLLPSASGFQSKLEGQISAPIKKAGSKMGGLLGSTLKKGAIGVTAAAGAALGTALFKGFGRLDAIDQAKAKLIGLGNSTKTVNKIMDNALKSVKGTAFGLDEAATTAGSVVAAGIKPGMQLQGVLKTVADTATIAGTSMSDMGLIFGSVAARGKLQGDDLMQLQSRGIPVLATLAKHYGITAQAASMMVSKGQVDFKDFADAMHEKLGGAALESGKTFKGAMANMLASLGRIGANLLSGIFPQLKQGLGGLTGILSDFEPVAARIGDSIGKLVTKVGDKLPSVIAALSPLGDSLGRVAKIGWGKLQSGLDALKGLTKLDFSKIDTSKLGKTLAEGIFKGLGALGELGGKLLDIASKVDWIGLGIKAGTYAIPFAIGLVTGILNGISSPELWSGIKDHLGEILIATLSIALAPAKLIGPLAKILERIPFAGKFLAWIVTGINRAGGAVKDYVGQWFGRVWSRVTRGLHLPGAGIVTKVLNGLKDLPGRVGGFLGSLAPRFGSWGLKMADRLGDALREAPGKALGALKALPGKVKGFFSAAGTWLVDAGKKIIGGLVSGLASYPKKLLGVVGGIGGWIKAHKGPPAKDAILLIPAGEAIIDGLNRGLGSYPKKLTPTLKGISDTLSGKGRKKTSLHDTLLKDFLAGSRNGKGKLTKAARKAAEALSKQIARGLGSGNNTAIGKALSSLVDNISKLPKRMRSAVKGMAKAAQSMIKQIADKSQALKDLAASVADAWRPQDLFSGTIGALTSGLSKAKSGLTSVIKALPTLVSKGLHGDFLNQLFSSGNTGLILTLAGSDTSTVKALQSQYDAVQSMATDLGQSVAGRDKTASEIVKLGDRLDKKLEQIRKELAAAPKKTGHEVSKGTNKSAADGKRRGKAA